MPTGGAGIPDLADCEEEALAFACGLSYPYYWGGVSRNFIDDLPSQAEHVSLGANPNILV